MRLARLAVLGLAVGVITGFAIALLRTRPFAADASPPLVSPDPQPSDSSASTRTVGGRARTSASPATPTTGTTGPASTTTTTTAAVDDDATVLDVRTHRRVTG